MTDVHGATRIKVEQRAHEGKGNPFVRTRIIVQGPSGRQVLDIYTDGLHIPEVPIEVKPLVKDEVPS